ncbi:hypothetical protein Mgrana_02940 [Meiothermus granaticius NBRC 107808]|uniref:Uncharacterized protein n=2 Tax=Meiothermus TaxID=65551 RepID=A0A399F6A6_9DEIN|nr:hypothetical protein Mgrana_02940 [Meiothermus granaticius NBRC 107808]
MAMRLIPLLLTALLLAACNQQVKTSSKPAPPPLDPPADGPITWTYDHDSGRLVLWMKEAAAGLELNIYIEDLEGQHRTQWYGIAPYDVQSNPARWPIKSLYGNEGYIIHYALDTTWDKRYGGRKFYWKYRYKTSTQQEPWQFEAPVGPVTFQVIDRFPWEEPGQTISPRDVSIRDSLDTGPIIKPFLGCLQENLDEYRSRGLYAFSAHTTAIQWFDEPVSKPGYPSFTYQWIWSDGIYDGFIGTTVPDGTYLADPRPQPLQKIAALDNRLHRQIVVAYAEGTGPFPHAWEKRYWRLAGRGFGAFEQPDGSVKCEFGEWRLDEVTDPDLIAWMDSWRTTKRSQPPYDSPVDPRLIPQGW